LSSEHLGTWQLWSNSGVFVGFFEMIIAFIIHGLWILPIYGWLLLVSSAVTKVPFVWAVLTPVVPILLERVTFGTMALGQGIGNHIQFKALPRPAQFEDGVMTENAVDLSDSFGLFATTDMWIGVVVGVAFIFGAVYFRRRNNEI
jgi:ABC-2 type transport system permease protein